MPSTAGGSTAAVPTVAVPAGEHSGRVGPLRSAPRFPIVGGADAVAAQHDRRAALGSAQRTALDWRAARFGGPAVESQTRTRPPPYRSGLPASAEPTRRPRRPCPRCGVANDAALRFCRKCGLALSGPVLHDDGPSRPEPAERIPWWRRWFRPGDKTRRAARRAYRHSLPLRYRLVRWVLGLLGVGAIVGAMTVIGQNPVGWVTDRINDLRGSLVQVEGLQAYTAPQGGADPVATSGAADPSGADAAPAAPDTAENVLDNLSDTAWATAWSAANQTNPADAPCVAPSSPSAAGAPGSILIVPSGTLTVREISVAAGRSKVDPGRHAGVATQDRPAGVLRRDLPADHPRPTPTSCSR